MPELECARRERVVGRHDCVDEARYLSAVGVLPMPKRCKRIRVVPGGSAARVVVVRGVEIDVVFGVEVAESLAQFIHHADAVRLEQAGQIGVDEHYALARRGVGDDVGARPHALQKTGGDLAEVGVAHHSLACDGAGEIALARPDQIARRRCGRCCSGSECACHSDTDHACSDSPRRGAEESASAHPARCGVVV